GRNPWTQSLGEVTPLLDKLTMINKINFKAKNLIPFPAGSCPSLIGTKQVVASTKKIRYLKQRLADH
ncbi:MAG: hypothetical protein LRZ99_04595, partial [Desulfotomaculum sp.]|nr:hypothetical protein [Desulfotomaculum sp.]